MFSEISKNGTRAFFPEWIGLLGREPNKQTVLLLVLHYVLHKILDRFAYSDPLDRSFPAQLLGDLTLLLQI